MKTLLFFLFIALRLSATTRYVDSIATGSNNGTSWANAWTALPTSGVSPGDTVYISGGPSGGTQAYSRTTFWTPPNGTSGNPVTYQIGQDSAHNGQAVFTMTPTGFTTFMTDLSYVNFVGDAGDGLYHFKLVGMSDVVTNVTQSRVAYVEAIDTIFAFADLQRAGSATTGNEIDHCNIKVTNTAADRVIYVAGTGSDPTGVRIHHNIIYAPNIGPGFGCDVIQAANSGISFYNNVIAGYYLSTYVGGQHQDGIQMGGAANVSIYNNRFLDIGNYAVFMECAAGPYTTLYVYNNEAIISDPAIRAGTPGAYVFGFSSGYSGPSPCNNVDCYIVNNAVVDYPTANNTCGLSMTNTVGASSTFTGCFISNNVQINGPTAVNTTGAATVTVANNISVTSANAATYFATYTAATGGLSNNLNLRAAATTLIGAASTLSTIFTTDAAGTTRTVPWDVGPYKYASLGISATPRFPLFQRQPRR